MTNSGTYTFNPSIGSMGLSAFGRCGVRRTELTAQHMEDLFQETNLMQSSWSADGITFWTVELVQQPITAGAATYGVPLNVISVLDAYINNGSSNRLLFPFSRTDFSSLATPNQPGPPTSFWFDRVISQTMTLWPVPDTSATFTLYYYAYTQPADALLQQGGNATVPYYWLDAFVAGLAHRLARIYAPPLEQARKLDAKEAYDRACKQVENVALHITPGLSGYFRP